MSLDEIIINTILFVGLILLILITISYISYKRNKRVQLNSFILDSDNEINSSAQLTSPGTHSNNIISVVSDQYQLKLPFDLEINEKTISHREEIVKEYFQTRKRYTLVNPASIEMRKVSNFY